MIDFKESLTSAEARLNNIITFQDPIYGLQRQTLDDLRVSLLESKSASNPETASLLANTIVFAIRANPSNCELYAEIINDLVSSTPSFARIVRYVIWREVNDPAIQFLVVLLLERGIITPEYMIDRVISAANPALSPILGFYFFPEWATNDSFFEKYLEPESPRFTIWDHKYTIQCELKHNGRNLAADDYKLFKELRRKGENHNPLAQLLAADDQETLIPFVDNDKIDVDAILPLSIFERRKYGKTKPISLIEYCSLIGSTKCFKYLLYNNAKIGPRVPKYAAMLGHQEIIQLAANRRIPLEPAIVGGIKGYHFTLLKSLHETQHIPVKPKEILSMAEYKLKGIQYLLTRNIDFSKVMEETPLLQAEDRTQVSYEHILLLRAAELDDRFLLSILCSIEGFDIFLETNQRHPTALHAAAASNSVGALKLLLSYSGSDVNKESRGETPLMTAATNNAIEVIELLGTFSELDPNRKVGNRTALEIAREAGATITCNALLAIGCVN